MRTWLKAVSFAAALTLAALSPAAKAQQAPSAPCTQELRDGHAKFLKDLRAHNFKSGAASGSGQAAAEVTKWLKTVHEDTIRHEEAHAKAAGKWRGKIEYMYYTWWNVPYAVAGCHIAKDGQPLEVALKTLLAPERPSDHDMKVAVKVKTYITIKKEREKCRAQGAPTAQRQCLAKHEGYAWLDSYPLR